MAVCLANNGTALTRADIYYNDNGTIKNINDMEVWLKNTQDNNFYKFPQKDFCKCNLDNTTFSTNKLDGASTYLTNNFEFWIDTSNQTHLGQLVQTDPGTNNGVRVNNQDKYWHINNTKLLNLYFGEDLLVNRKVSMFMKCKLRGRPTDWNQLFEFHNNQRIRIEWNPTNRDFWFYTTGLGADGEFPQINYDDWFTIGFVIDGRTVKGYQNGVEVFTTSLNNDMSINYPKFYLCDQIWGSANFGAAVYIKNLTLWTTALSDQEVIDYHKCIS